MISAASIFYNVFRFLQDRRRAYQMVFAKGPMQQIVLYDLAKFCRAHANCTTEREAGRREVWLRIEQHLKLDEEDLVALYGALSDQDRVRLFNPTGDTNGSA